ncbi:MAG: molybdopterin-dependent oxidoreductase [Armatimonadetes bacterium]|nr:molybdopterin-dependent oxidoreductase [Armatimonadota bacterium]
MKFSRRQFLKTAGLTSGALLLADSTLGGGLRTLQPAVNVQNPLKHYPDRGWEQVLRDQYRYDRAFTFVCAPNDTHNCRLRALVRDDVIVRIEQNYDAGHIEALDGTATTAAWNPRGCLKGFTFHRRVYSPYRLKYPMIRKGWKEWADAGFPELTPELKKKYKFDSRGSDQLLRAGWQEASDYVARAMVAISTRYSGEEGAARLKQQGYEPEMIEDMGGAGTRTMKFRGGMGLLGVIGKYGMWRAANMVALLDSHVRKVSPEQAKGGRKWSNYTWHGDQAPGMPFVHGLQASDVDMNQLRFARLSIACGTNIIENKMPEAHFFTELMERGGRLVVIKPEYSPTSQKADYWIPIRPNTDAALFLGITRLMMDNGWYDEAFVKGFTDFPLLVRADNLKLLRASELFSDHKPLLASDGMSMKRQNLKPDQYEKLGDFVVRSADGFKAISRDDVGGTMAGRGIDPTLDWQGKARLANGQEIECLTLWTAYKRHLEDYGLDAVAQMTSSPKELIERLAKEIWDVTLEVREQDPTAGAVAIHIGEGINHWFHATLANRAFYLPLMLTGNIGKVGSGCHTWAGNYKGGLFQGSPWTGPGFPGFIAEDPFNLSLDPASHGKDVKVRKLFKDEEPAYWNHGDRPLIVNTPKHGRKVFTGKTHMPTPTKFLWFNNVNLFNNAKHAYDMFFNVNPNIECIVCQDVEMNSTVEYSDVVFAANTWVEFEDYEMTASCSNPFLQIWNGGIRPIYDTKDDLTIIRGVFESLAKLTGDRRFADAYKFKAPVYIQRLLDSSTTTFGYTFADIMAGKYGEPGVCLMMFRTYPREPFYEQVFENEPFHTATGRLQAYCDIPEAIEAGENFIVHREGPEATPYLPNVIVSTNPYVRPDDYGISAEAMHWDERTVRNIKMPWSQVKETTNPLWEKGYRFYGLTPKGRHRVHSGWSMVDWNQIWESNFGDAYRLDRRSPGVGETQMHIHPDAAKEMGISDGDYVYVDANPMDRPYRGWKPTDPQYRVARLMVRARYNPAFPKQVVMIRHSPSIATERSVKAHETRPDGRAQSVDTGYQSNVRYGGHQALTRNWHMPMHQTDTLFHKSKAMVAFIFGGEADNHAINTVPKETLVKITKAEDGGLGGKGVWKPATTGFSPGRESEFMQRYLAGELVE